MANQNLVAYGGKDPKVAVQLAERATEAEADCDIADRRQERLDRLTDRGREQKSIAFARLLDTYPDARSLVGDASGGQINAASGDAFATIKYSIGRTQLLGAQQHAITFTSPLGSTGLARTPQSLAYSTYWLRGIDSSSKTPIVDLLWVGGLAPKLIYTDASVKCLQGAFGPPEKGYSRLYKYPWRTEFAKFSLSPTVSYNDGTKETRFELPIYFIRPVRPAGSLKPWRRLPRPAGRLWRRSRTLVASSVAFASRHRCQPQAPSRRRTPIIGGTQAAGDLLTAP